MQKFVRINSAFFIVNSYNDREMEDDEIKYIKIYSKGDYF